MEGERRVSLWGEKKGTKRGRRRQGTGGDLGSGEWKVGAGAVGDVGGGVGGEEAKAKGESEQRARPGATAAAGSDWYTSQL